MHALLGGLCPAVIHLDCGRTFPDRMAEIGARMAQLGCWLCFLQGFLGIGQSSFSSEVQVFGGQEEEEEEGDGEGRVSETLLFVPRLRACDGAAYR